MPIHNGPISEKPAYTLVVNVVGEVGIVAHRHPISLFFFILRNGRMTSKVDSRGGGVERGDWCDYHYFRYPSTYSERKLTRPSQSRKLFFRVHWYFC